MAKINIEFDGKIYSVDESTLTSLASPLERALIQQLAGTGAVIRFGSTNYNVDANKLASARNVLTSHFGNVAGTDSKVTVNGTEYGLSKTKLQNAADKMNDTLSGMSVKPSEGLAYSLNSDGQSYSVVGIGTCTDADIVIPSKYEGLSVTAIGTYAFESEWLNSVTISNGVTSIDSHAFAWCKSLTSINIPDSVTSIGHNAFQGTRRLESIKLPNNLMSISDYMLSWCNITSIEIPNSVTSIGNYAFEGCEHLTSISIPNGVTSIGDYAFTECSSLTSITIPDSVMSIGDNAFKKIDDREEPLNIYIDKPEGSISGAPWGGTTKVIVHWRSEEPELTPSEGLEFELNDDGQSYYVSGIGTCTDNEVVIPSYYNDLPVTDIYVASKGRGPLNKENVYSIVLPNTFTKISDGLFLMHYRLQSVIIPNSVTTIEGNAFQECGSLTSITIPNSVTSIGYAAFADCRNLTDIVFEGTVVEWNTIEKGEEWKYYVPATYVQCTDGQVAL